MKYLALTALLLAGTANAQDITTPLLGQNPMLQNDLGMTVGVKAGVLNAGLGKNPISVGVSIAKPYTQNFGVEAEYVYSQRVNYTTSEGVVHKTGDKGADDSQPTMTPIYYSTKAGTTLGAYGTYRYHFADDSPLYVKAKLGVAYSAVEGARVYFQKGIEEATDKKGDIVETKVENRIVSNIGRSSKNMSAGLGVGYRMGDLALEAEYTRLNKDSALMTAGATMRF